jgi:hypothetical protein
MNIYISQSGRNINIDSETPDRLLFMKCRHIKKQKNKQNNFYPGKNPVDYPAEIPYFPVGHLSGIHSK